MTVPDADSIAGVAARLALWGTRAPKGLARVEFDSDFSRRDAEAQVRDACAAADIPFHAIELPQFTPAAEVVIFLLGTLAGLPNGVVSISGWATAFPADIPLIESLRVLNYNRENLAQYPLRQIWWMTRPFTDALIRNIPDLASWFIVRLTLRENTVPAHAEPSVSIVPLASPEQLDDARKRSATLWERFTNSLNGEIDLPDWSALGNNAVQELNNVGLGGEAQILSGQAVKTIVSTPAYQDYLSGALSLHDKEQVRLLKNLADLYIIQRNYQAAEAALEKALAFTEIIAGPESEDTSLFLNEIAFLYNEEGKYGKAEPLFKRSLEIIEEAVGREHPNTASCINNLALVYYHQNRYAEAEPLFKTSLALWEKIFGLEHSKTAQGLNNLAMLYIKQGRYVEAEALLKNSLAIWEKTLGLEHPDTAMGLNNLAGLYKKQGRYSTAEPLLKRALVIHKICYGQLHPDTILVMENYADLLQKMGRKGEAWMMQSRADGLKVDMAKKNNGS